MRAAARDTAEVRVGVRHIALAEVVESPRQDGAVFLQTQRVVTAAGNRDEAVIGSGTLHWP